MDTAHSQLQQLKQSYLYILSRGVCPPSTSLNLLINKDKTVLTVGFVSVLSAGVSCDLVVYPGACHAFQQIETSELAKRYQDDFMNALERGLRG